MANPLKAFELQPIAELSVAGLNLSFTNHSAWLVGVSLFLAVFLAFAMRRATLVPGRLQGFVEMTYGLIEGLLDDTTGREGLKYLPVVFTLFVFIASLNLAGMIPGSFTVTSQVLSTGFMAAAVIVFVILVGFAKHGLGFFGLFLPTGVPVWLAPIMVPLELVSFFIRPFTLAIRLGANMLAGSIAVKIFAGFVAGLVAMEGAMALGGIFPLAGLVALSLLKIVVSLLQAYIFTMLSCVYLGDALNLH